MVKISRVITAGIAFSLLGCVPWPTTYDYMKFDYDGGIQLRKGLNSGPPGYFIFGYHGVLISTMFDNNLFKLMIRIPKNHSVKLLDKKAMLTYKINAINFESILVLMFVPRFLEPGVVNSGEGGDGFGTLVGDTVEVGILKQKNYKGYLYCSTINMNGIEEGEVHLPEMLIDGETVDGLRLHFSLNKITYAESSFVYAQ
jgi:hypothetical protein